MKLGLDELIIVNPGSPATATETSWFLGADGGVYRLGRPTPSQSGGPPIDDAALGETEAVPRFFLGDDGILYETR
jgi:hypothetical protein